MVSPNIYAGMAGQSKPKYALFDKRQMAAASGLLAILIGATPIADVYRFVANVTPKPKEAIFKYALTGVRRMLIVL